MPSKLHNAVFDFLEEYRVKDPEFLYWLRERNTKNRLEDGYWFQGQDDYAFVGLYDRGGGTNMTRSFGLVFYPNEKKLVVILKMFSMMKVIRMYYRYMRILEKS